MEQGDGLRARKKRETRRALERAALELVAEKGYEKTTIDDICARANVSRMTFFNYFPSKLTVILGYDAEPPSAEDMERLLEGSSDECYLDALTHLLAECFASKLDPEIQKLRCEVLDKNMCLLLKDQHGANRNRQAVNEALRSFLLAHPERRMIEGATLEEEVFQGASFATYLAKILAYRRLYKDKGLTAAELRRSFAVYTQA